MVNYFATPIYMVSSSILIKEDTRTQSGNATDYLNSSLFKTNPNFQNALWVLKSTPVIQQTVNNLDLTISYYFKDGIQYLNAYEDLPFQVLLLRNHLQPVNTRFTIAIQDKGNFTIKAKSRKVAFVNFTTNEIGDQKDIWEFNHNGKFGKLIETDDLAFIIKLDTISRVFYKKEFIYSFIISDENSLTENLKNSLQFNVVDKQATVVEIAYKTESIKRGKDILNELMNVYSQQDLNQKNHIADITIDYIEKQLNEISDSLSQTEDNLQRFRTSNQLLNVTEQSSGISAQYMNLQNQLAELVTRKRYYDYVSDYLTTNNDFSNMIVPASMGIPDQLLNSLMSELIAAQAQRSNLIENKQEKNPLVQKLTIQIENTKKTISENIAAVRKTTEISLEEMRKRIGKVEAEISRIPKTQRQLGGIERKYRLNDAIYNYLLEKRAEAKITQASNLPDNTIIEPAKMQGTSPIFPNKRKNYMIAMFLGLGIPFLYLLIRSGLSNKIESFENIDTPSDIPVLGKIMHNLRKSNNVMFEYPKSSIAESYRVFRTNLDYHFKGFSQKVIMVTSSIAGEGKSFNALNLAMSYAQLGRKTILLDFDLRKPTGFFSQQGESLLGISSYYAGKVGIDEIILKSPHEKLHYMPSGPIPPNPVELLALDKTKELVTELLSLYDCIIIDTTPLAQVTDAFLLMDLVNIKIIVVRYKFTNKRIFSLIMKDLRQKNINNVCVLMNDNRVFRDQYGYGYGYNKK
jgi:tyrosine-protein kinase Etk/Wzc